MENIAIIYESKAGHTEKYAKWIKEALGTGIDIFDTSEIKNSDKLVGYDFILFGSGIYNEKLPVAAFIKKFAGTIKFKKFAVFAVGASAGSNESINKLKEKNFSSDMRKFRIFQLRGGYDPARLSFMDKAAASLLHSKIMKKEIKNDDDFMLLGLIESQKDYTQKENIVPIVEFISTGAWKRST